MYQDNRRILIAWCALLALLAVTCASSWLAMGAWNTVVNLGIAAIKAAIVLFVFMHLGANSAIRACVGIALLVLLLMITLAGSDYATRDLRPAPWQTPSEPTHGDAL